MIKQYIYRMVEVNRYDVVNMSDKFCLTKEQVNKYIETEADYYKRFTEDVVEDYKGHKWDSVAVSECGKVKWLTVEKVKTVTDDRGYERVFGFLTYEIA